MRDLAHGIYPPLLRQAGLPDALRAAAQRSPAPVTVSAHGVGRAGAEVEAAVYFCASRRCRTSPSTRPARRPRCVLTETPGELALEVSDDGPGFDPATAEGGQGLQNMTDRLGAVGGRLRWESDAGTGHPAAPAGPADGGAP